MSHVRPYKKEGSEVLAIQLNSYGDFVRAEAWVNQNGGTARHSIGHDGTGSPVDYMLLDFGAGLCEVEEGSFIVLDQGAFLPMLEDVFKNEFEVVQTFEEPPVATYVPSDRSDRNTPPPKRKTYLG